MRSSSKAPGAPAAVAVETMERVRDAMKITYR